MAGVADIIPAPNSPGLRQRVNDDWVMAQLNVIERELSPGGRRSVSALRPYWTPTLSIGRPAKPSGRAPTTR